MEKEYVNIEYKYTTLNVEPNNWYVNLRRYSNWAAIAQLTENGEEVREYLKCSNDKGVFFSVENVKPGDILVFGIHDNYKHNHSRGYYIVESIDAECMTLLTEDNKPGFSTIRKALKAKKEYLNE